MRGLGEKRAVKRVISDEDVRLRVAQVAELEDSAKFVSDS